MAKFKRVLSTGHEIELPPFERIPAGVVRKLRHLVDGDFTFAILEELLSEDDLAAMDAVPLEEWGQLVSDWQGEATARVGESSASSSS